MESATYFAIGLHQKYEVELKTKQSHVLKKGDEIIGEEDNS
jgi:hypothetical protein